MHVPTRFTLFTLLALEVAMASPHATGQHRRHRRFLSPGGSTGVEAREFRGGGRNDTFGDANGDSASVSSTTDLASSQTDATSSIASSSAVSSTDTAQVQQSSAVQLSSSPTSTQSISATTPFTQATSATSSAPISSSAPPTVAQQSSSSSSIDSAPVDTAPTTVAPQTLAQQTTSTITRVSQASLTTVKSTASASATAEASNNSSSTSGLSKPALIGIIVAAVVVGVAVLGWCAFRKWKLRPSGRFDRKMKPIDFGPNVGHNDDFLEKTLHRSTSNSSAAHQRNLLAAEVDATTPNHVAGIPEHDFTAVPSHGVNNGVYDMYNQDPYYHAEAYEYDPTTYAHQQAQHDYPSQDQPITDGYADLQRGNSGGSGSAHGHRGQHTHAAPAQVFPDEFPSPENYLGRPTGGSDGPYAQAAQYRQY